MNENQRVAYVMSQAACMIVKAMGMQADNKAREYRGEAPASDSTNFELLIQEFGMGQSDVLKYLQGNPEWKGPM